MTVKIKIYNYKENHIFKNLINELKNKKPTSIKEDVFGIDLELNVNSFDEIIYLLEKYNSEIEIELSIWSIDKIRVYISSKSESCSLGDQVE